MTSNCQSHKISKKTPKNPDDPKMSRELDSELDAVPKNVAMKTDIEDDQKILTAKCQEDNQNL